MTVIVRQKADRIFFNLDGKVTVTTYGGETTPSYGSVFDDCHLLDVDRFANRAIIRDRTNHQTRVYDFQKSFVTHRYDIGLSEFTFDPNGDAVLVSTDSSLVAATSTYVETFDHATRPSPAYFDNWLATEPLFALGAWHPHLRWYCVPGRRHITSFDVVHQTVTVEKSPLKSPRHLRFDSNGNYYVSDQQEKLHKLTPDLEVLWSTDLQKLFGELGQIHDVIVVGKHLVVPGGFDQEYRWGIDFVFDSGSGDHIATWEGFDERGAVHATYDEHHVITNQKKLINVATGEVRHLGD